MNDALKLGAGLLLAGIVALRLLRQQEKSGKHKLADPTTTQTPQGFFGTLEKKHHFGLIIAYGLFPVVLAISMGWNPFGLWESPYRWTYVMIGLASFVIGGILRFKGDTGRQILMWLYVALIIVSVGRLVTGLAARNERISYVLDRDWKIAFPTNRIKDVADIDPLDRKHVEVPEVWQDVGQPPNFGHRYDLEKGWNRTFVFKVAGEDDFFILSKNADVVASFEGYGVEENEPSTYTMPAEATKDHQGVWIPSEFNGRLFLYSASSGNEVLVYKKFGGFVLNADRELLKQRSFDRSEVLAEAEAGPWQVVLRNPDLTFELPETRFNAGQELYLEASGPLVWMNGTRATLLKPEGGKPIRLRLADSGYLRLRPHGPHDVFLRILSP